MRPVHAFWHRVDFMLAPCWHLFGTCGHDFGTTGHHGETPGQQFVVCETHVWNLMRFWLLSGPCGALFFIIGVTILIPGVWNGEICVFCGQPDFRLDFGAKSDEFLRYLGWLKKWFGVGGVVKITVSVEHGFSRFGTPF